MSTSSYSGQEGYVHPDPSSISRTPFRAAVLVLASICIGILLCEVSLRLFTRFRPGVVLTTVSQDSSSMTAQAQRFAEQFVAASGTDKRWFAEDPPQLQNRSRVDPQRLAGAAEYKRRGIFPAQSDYIWNQYYVESQRCGPSGVFDTFPDRVLAFDPPTTAPHPRYRFPPNTTTANGLVTNQFGLRGPPVALSKPPKTIRIAFIGASTTVGNHEFPFSYPERVAYWLNRYAQSNRLEVRFEALNAGREGQNSEDIAAITRDELLALDPDLAVYYEGSNQFSPLAVPMSPRIQPRLNLDPSDTIVGHRVPDLIRTHLASAELLDRTLNGFRSAGEPRKPFYDLRWPHGVNQQNPDVDSPNLPLQLPVIVRDLDSIRGSLGTIGAELVLCSFEWLVKDGMPLSPVRHEFIYKQLNTTLWPLRYADIRRLADFQNRVFRRYAVTRNIPFLDVASALPQDPTFFSDAIHMTEPGERVKAWIVFQQLVPLIRKRIESGELPRASRSHPVPPPPSLAASLVTVRCVEDPSGPLDRIEGGMPLETISLANSQASIRYGLPVKVITPGPQWSFAASFGVNVPAGLSRPCYLFLRARVVRGRIGLGVLDRDNHTFQLEKAVEPSTSMKNVYVPVLFPERADRLVIRNTAPEGIPSEVWIEDAALLAFLKPLPEETVNTIVLDRFQPGDPRDRLERNREGLVVTGIPGLGAFAARMSLALKPDAGVGLRVHISMRVLQGTIGVGILSPDSKAFLVERALWPSSRPIDVIVPVPSLPVGDLVISNESADAVSKVIVEKIEVRKPL
jgi:hypothetical protein